MGTVTTVEVSALPAVKLLFGNVESAAIRMSSATLDAEINSLQAGPFDVGVGLTHEARTVAGCC